jgi:hypothetical protein
MSKQTSPPQHSLARRDVFSVRPEGIFFLGEWRVPLI